MKAPKENNDFESLINSFSSLSYDRHADSLIEHALFNQAYIKKSIKNLPALIPEKAKSAIILSAGPSIHRQKSIQQILDSNYQGTLIAVDGCLVTAIKMGLYPDFVLTLDPHKKRIVRWFGDPDLQENMANDDYFARQDLDVNFRNNMEAENLRNIELINQAGSRIKAVISTSIPRNVLNRLNTAKFDCYWWNPIVDDPNQPDSLTRKLYNVNPIPCMNTGGNVGTAAWVFASSFLKIPNIALLGMDLGYYHDLPYSMTQTYYELIAHSGTMDNLESYFPEFVYPLTGERFYSDPTYCWYRKNFLQLLENSSAKTYNCTGGGTLFGEQLECISLADFLKSVG